MSAAGATGGTMTVTVMFRDNWFGGDGWTYGPVTVTIAATCPVCGGPRGAPWDYRFCEDEAWLTVSRWQNACGHLDTYRAVLIEVRHPAAVAAGLCAPAAAEE